MCYVKLTAEEKREKLRFKLLKTPEALAIDAGRTVLVLAYVFLNAVVTISRPQATRTQSACHINGVVLSIKS